MKRGARTKPATQESPAKKVTARNVTTRKVTAKKVTAKPARPEMAARRFGPRADLGAPVDGFFAKQPPNLRPILDTLRELVAEVAPDARSSIKWGMPFYVMGDETVCALAGFKAHVNLILPGPPGTYADPQGLLEGDGKTGRHLKVRSIEELPRSTIRGWLGTAAARARQAGSR